MEQLIKGIHHVFLNCKGPEKYQETLDFYKNILCLPIEQEWIRDGKPACMVKAGDGWIEIHSDEEEDKGTGVIGHFALLVDDADMVYDHLKKKGYPIKRGIKENVLPMSPPWHIRTMFLTGPLGEEIELFEKGTL